MRSTFGLAMTVVLSMACADTTLAQSDLLNKAKGLLQSTGGTGNGGSVSSGLSSSEVSGGLKEALRVGSSRVVDQLGTNGGFLNDPAVHIPLPPGLEKVQPVLKMAGISGLADEVELKLNRAAETATPKAKAIFLEAIEHMTLEDAQAIYKGPDDAATRYFQSKMTPSLKTEMRPVVDASLADVGAVKAYDDMMAEYKNLPFAPDAKAELGDWGLQKTLDGIFYYLAQEEKAIRTNPAARTTEVLQKVFGG
ncbi:MAG: DUF4197 domain-containing protein [Hyphomicrobiales bacterium]|nr:DUF4197 domain-containing protein [Hyphomicrobiales bacterium]